MRLEMKFNSSELLDRHGYQLGPFDYHDLSVYPTEAIADAISTGRHKIYDGAITNLIEELTHRLADHNEVLEIIDPTEEHLALKSRGLRLVHDRGVIDYRGHVREVKHLGGTTVVRGNVSTVEKVESGQVYIEGNLNRTGQIGDSGILLVTGRIDDFARINELGDKSRPEILPGPFIFTEKFPEEEEEEKYDSERPPFVTSGMLSNNSSAEVVASYCISEARRLLVRAARRTLATVSYEIKTEDDLKTFMASQLEPYRAGYRAGYNAGWRSVPYPSD